MTTSPVSNQSIYQDIRAFHQTRSSDLKQLSQALQSGDLSAAQQAYDALVTLGQSSPFRNAEPFRRSDRVTDFNAIGQALQAGDLNTAQSAFATLLATWSKEQPAPSVAGSPTVVTLGPMPPTFAPPPTQPPAAQPFDTMPPTFKPPQTQPPATQREDTMPPVFKLPPTNPAAIQVHRTSPPTFKPPETTATEAVGNIFDTQA